MFRVVKYFIYCDYDISKGDDEWDGIVKNQERLQVKWAHVPGNGNKDWDVPPPPNDWVRVLGKESECELKGINIFMREDVICHFYWGKPKGWILHHRIKSETVAAKKECVIVDNANCAPKSIRKFKIGSVLRKIHF